MARRFAAVLILSGHAQALRVPRPQLRVAGRARAMMNPRGPAIPYALRTSHATLYATDAAAAAVEEVRSHVDRVLDLPPVTLVPAHRDNHPRNWILDSGQKVKLHNFATSEYDPWVVDVFPLSQEYWRADSQLKLAFLSGYDRQLDAQDLTILKAYHAVMAVSAIAASGRSSGTRLERIRSQDLIDSLLGITLF